MEDLRFCSVLLLVQLEQGEGEPSVSSAITTYSEDLRLARQEAAQFLREAEKNRRQWVQI